MFSVTDVKHVLAALPPSTKPLGSGITFLPSLSGHSFVSLTTAKSDLRRLVNDQECVPIQDLARLLDIQDISSLLEWADGEPDFSTPRNGQPSLPPWIQKTIAIHFFAQTRYRLTTLHDEARFWSLPVAIVEKIIKVYETSFGTLQDTGGHLARPSLLKRVKASLLSSCRTAEAKAEVKNLSDARADVPPVVLRALMGQLRNQGVLQQFEIDTRKDGVWFVPVEAISRHAQEKQKMSLAGYAEILASSGYCIITEKDAAASTIVEQLGFNHASAEEPSPDRILQLVKHADTSPTDWPSASSIVLIKQFLLTATLETLLYRIPATASTTWQSTQDSDPTFNPSVISSLHTTEPQSLILHSTASHPIRQAYTTQLAALATQSTQSLWTHLQTTLLLPLTLHLATLPHCTPDPTLHDHQSTFLLSHLQSLALTSLSSVPLPPPVSLATELSRFRSSAASAPSLDTLHSAARRLARKTRPSFPDADAESALAVRDAHLAALLKRLDGARRASDVLQHAAWVLLAGVAGAEGEVWVSGGRDAGRVVKVLARRAGEITRDEDGEGDQRGFDWVAAAGVVEAFRVKVKEGKESEDEVRAVRELARKGWEARRLR